VGSDGDSYVARAPLFGDRLPSPSTRQDYAIVYAGMAPVPVQGAPLHNGTAVRPAGWAAWFRLDVADQVHYAPAMVTCRRVCGV
jgi:hypothetical protein